MRHVEGSAHAFLVVRDSNGKAIGGGELVQTVRGGRVKDHLFLHFKDGSVDDETSVFTQRGTFRLVSDRHIQRGPSYTHPMDVAVDALTGTVTVHSVDKDGKAKVTVDHLDLPADLANGIVLIELMNIDPKAPETKVSLLAATPKPRMVKLRISPLEEDPFYVAGTRRKFMHYVVKIELGGIAGVVAPLIGKQPGDMHVWLLGGAAPALVREQGALYDGGPVWTIEQTLPVWPHTAP